MTPDHLAELGRALFGMRWQTELARELCVTDRTMRRWVRGQVRIPDGLDAQLRTLAAARISGIAAAAGLDVEFSPDEGERR